MTRRRGLLLGSLAAALPPVAAKARARAVDGPGPLNAAMARRAGRWTVTETVWPAPDAAPVVTRGLLAERVAFGSFLQETLRERWGGPVLRMDLLTYDRLEGRWEYVSIETRAEVGIMPAWSFGPDDPSRIALAFAPFAMPGDGADLSGRLLRMTQTIVGESDDADRKDQVFAPADGTGRSWLAHRYRYRRTPGTG